MDLIEQGFIGALLGNKEKVSGIFDVVRPTDFTDPRCGLVYDAIIEIAKEGGSPDLVSVYKKLAGKIDGGWLSTLTDESSMMPTADAHIIADRSKAKKIEIRMKNLLGQNLPCDQLVQELILITEYATAKKTDQDAKIGEVISRFCSLVKNNQESSEYGIDTGYMFLEQKYIRYMPGHVWCIGGVTSVGKTAVMVDMLCRLMDSQKPRKIIIISTEMMEEQNIARLLARKTGYHSSLILSGKLREGWDEINKTLEWLAGKDVSLFDNIYQFQEMETKLRQLSMSGKIDVVFLDYVQNMSYAGAKTEYEKTERMAKGVQRLAKQLKCTFVCMSQIPNSEAINDSGMLMFKGGGEWAAVADLGVWLKRSKKQKDLLCFDFRKNRHGQTGKQILQFVNNFVRLKEIPHDDNE